MLKMRRNVSKAFGSGYRPVQESGKGGVKPGLRIKRMEMEDQTTGLIEGADGVTRCAWHGNLPDYRHYHDDEWGRPVTDDRRLFEKICLEGFQSGLSWLTILRKRENFRAAFAGFDFDARRRLRRRRRRALLARMPASCAIAARSSRPSTMRARAMELVDGGRLARRLVLEVRAGRRRAAADVVDLGPSLANADHDRPRRCISKELKKRGWSFVGPTTVYAFMQAMGLVNDHIEGCVCRAGDRDASGRDSSGRAEAPIRTIGSEIRGR